MATNRHEGYAEEDTTVKEAAARALEETGLGVTPANVSPDGDPVVQVIVRVPETTRERWKNAAAAKGLSMSEFVRTATDDSAAQVLDCTHPSVRKYPWATICNGCGTRL